MNRVIIFVIFNFAFRQLRSRAATSKLRTIQRQYHFILKRVKSVLSFNTCKIIKKKTKKKTHSYKCKCVRVTTENEFCDRFYFI